MRFLAIIGIVGALWMVGVLQARSEQQTSTWSGVFTEEQAKAGQEAYTKACAECHGADLMGDGYTPVLKGPDFMANWNNLTVGEFYDRIRSSMPPSDPNSVSPAAKVQIVAHILKQNGFPTGKSELPGTSEGMKAIKIEATKSGR
jgi:S-disulfanyl-L-cysteine oxidoreductase SoxD